MVLPTIPGGTTWRHNIGCRPRQQKQTQHRPARRRSFFPFSFCLAFFLVAIWIIVGFFLQLNPFSQFGSESLQQQNEARSSSPPPPSIGKIEAMTTGKRGARENVQGKPDTHAEVEFQRKKDKRIEVYHQRKKEAQEMVLREEEEERKEVELQRNKEEAERIKEEEQRTEAEAESTGSKEDKRPEETKNEEEDMYFRDPDANVVDWDYFPSSKREPRRDASWAEAVKLESSLSSPPDKNECTRFMKSVDTSPPASRKVSGNACEGYDGVFHINHFDEGGASGTVFFLFTIAMLAWADQHNYLPWIHIEDNYTVPIWDPIVHTNTNTYTFQMQKGMNIGWARDPNDPKWHIFPGKPFLQNPLRSEELKVYGTGVWEHYFLPPNDFVPGDTSCRDKPIVKMDDAHIVPGIHSNAPWAPRAWRWVAPKYLDKFGSWDKWFEPQRKNGAAVTERYIRFNPMMEHRARCAFPNPEFSLGMHIRHGDKQGERNIVEVDRFFIFAEAFVNNGGGDIYLATDSSKVVETILKKWPKKVSDHVVHQPSVLALSSNETASFNLGVSPHRSNVEALTDLLALSKCTFLLHGLSAISEAALFLNPGLVARSINLDDEKYYDFFPDDFVKKLMPLGRNESKNEGKKN